MCKTLVSVEKVCTVSRASCAEAQEAPAIAPERMSESHADTGIVGMSGLTHEDVVGFLDGNGRAD
jgi:hypothetical protein